MYKRQTTHAIWVKYNRHTTLDFALALSELSAAVQSERGLSIIMPHCLEWYKLVPRTRLPTLAVRYLVLTCVSAGHVDELRLRLLSIDDVLNTVIVPLIPYILMTNII